MAAGNALQAERYGMGECVTCGDRLDDVSLAAGFSECGDCDPDPNAAWTEIYDAGWQSWPGTPTPERGYVAPVDMTDDEYARS